MPGPEVAVKARAPFQPAPNEVVRIGGYAALEGGGAAVVGQHGPVLLGQREDALNASDRDHTIVAVHALAERADMRSGSFTAGQ